MEFNITNSFSQDYLQILNNVEQLGKEVTPRGKKTLEIRPVSLIMSNPRKRMVTVAGREMNPFFLIVEALWILSGKEDVKTLLPYNSNIKQFSDDELFFHASYGRRLRHFGKSVYSNTQIEEINFVEGQMKMVANDFKDLDQLKGIVQAIQKDKDTRQAVATIWNPLQDLNFVSKDIPCLSGDTKFCSPENNYTIRQVYNLLKSGKIDFYPIYCYDEKKDEIILKNLEEIVFSGRKKTLEIELENGSLIRMTEDHRVYKRKDRKNLGFEIIEAKKLKVGDILLSDIFQEDRKGYLKHKKKLFKNTCYSNMKKIHREYYDFIYGETEDDFDIHHKDEDKKNNCIENLIKKEHGKHSKKHQNGIKNSIHNETDVKRRLRLFKRRLALRKRGWKVPDHPDDQLFDYLEKRVRIESKIKKIKNNKKCKNKNSSKIISVKEYGFEEVYDFKLPVFHNALFEKGVVLHNCNDLLMFKVRNNCLDMTVINRSNDLHWGVPTNLFQFSMIQDVLCYILNLNMGKYVHFTDSLHVYTEEYSAEISKKMWEAKKFDDFKSSLYFYMAPSAFCCNFNSVNDRYNLVFDVIEKSMFAIEDYENCWEAFVEKISKARKLSAEPDFEGMSEFLEEAFLQNEYFKSIRENSIYLYGMCYMALSYFLFKKATQILRSGELLGYALLRYACKMINIYSVELPQVDMLISCQNYLATQIWKKYQKDNTTVGIYKRLMEEFKKDVALMLSRRAIDLEQKPIMEFVFESWTE
jgi:thymidylate synthase